jgi:hypothetical protein
MSRSHIALAILFAVIFSNLTDWFFFGILFHKKYFAHPEVWWRQPGTKGGEAKPIAGSTAVSLITFFSFFAACNVFAIRGYSPALEFAALAWLIGPLPITITNSFFIKLHPLLVISHSLGWLARLLIAGAMVGWLLS